MNKIASTAVSFALLGAVANTHIANLHPRHSTQATKPKITVTAEATPAPVPPPPVMVNVQPGDSLSSIAAANGTTYVRLFDANDFLADPDVISPGQQLRIPTADEQLPDRMASVTPAAPTIRAASYTTSHQPNYTTAAYPVSDDSAKAFIYAHESGNNPNATSPNGCYGLGQDCNGRVQAQCGADYACQDTYFTNYATSRYGSWANAQAFWQTHGWW